MTTPGFIHAHGPARDQFPDKLGQTTAANSLCVVIASDYSITTIISNDTNYGAVGANTLRTASQIGNAGGAASFGAGAVSGQTLRVIIASDQSAIPASQSGAWNITNITGTVTLPTGAATAAKQPALGTAGTASSDVISVQGIASMTALKVDGSGVTQPVSATQSGTWNVTNVSGTVSLPTGASTSALQTTGNTSVASIDTKTPALGQAAMAASVPVVLASNQSSIPVTISSSVSVSGRAKVLDYRNDYTGVNVTTGAYVQVVASTGAQINKLWIFDSSGSAMILATGAAASEVDQIYIPPGGLDGPVDLQIAASTRVSLKALDTNATTGQVIIVGLS